MLPSNWLALIVTFAVALIWLRLMDFAAQRGWVSNRLSRKIIHMGTGPLYVMCWALFKDTPDARYLAALVPALITLQFTLVGFGILHDDASVQAMSRTGNPREILRGPLFYGIIFVVLTLVYWLENPIGIIALMILSGGDGLADIVGRRFGQAKLYWNQDKSWLGSLGMFTGSGIFALAMLFYYVALGTFAGPVTSYIIPVTVIALAATVVESFPLQDYDNITITLTAVLMGYLVL